MKRLSLSLVIALLLGITAWSVALAAPVQSGPGGYYCPYMQQAPNLTDEQRQQIAQWQNQMLDNRKQVLQKQVEWGWITQAQADQQMAYMQQWQSNGYGMWMSGGSMMGHGMMGHGMMGMGMMWGGRGYYSPYSQYGTNLTNEQKEQMAQWQNQLIENRKQILQKQVEWGWITQDQANRQVSYMDQWQSNGFGMWMMGGSMMGPMGSCCY